MYLVAFQTCPVVGLVTDERAVVRDVNAAAEEFFCVGRIAIVGKPLLYFVARGDTRMFRERVRVLRTVRSLLLELRPRGGRACVMRLTVERAPASYIWWAMPASGCTAGRSARETLEPLPTTTT